MERRNEKGSENTKRLLKMNEQDLTDIRNLLEDAEEYIAVEIHIDWTNSPDDLLNRIREMIVKIDGELIK
jgi:hypothetical protein